jgi:hypothetical protein
VDGSGLQRIADPVLATRLRTKVNTFNARSIAVVAIATLLYVAVPEIL